MVSPELYNRAAVGSALPDRTWGLWEIVAPVADRIGEAYRVWGTGLRVSRG